MALLPYPSLPLYSFELRQANFHPMPFSGKTPVVVRRLAKYHHSAICQFSSHDDSSTSKSPEKPPIPTWDDRFIESLDECRTESEAFNKIRIEELKEEVKNMLIYANDDPLQKIKLVDVIERLGLAYHFDKEIHSTLRQVYDDNEDFGDNLQAIALRFLLLRQHGYNVSCDVFEKFKDKEGNFKQCLKTDIMGLLSLYEASHFSIRGEDILDNSLTFTRQELSMAIHLDPTIARRVQRSLELPPQRGMPGLEVKHFISFYEDDESRNDVLLKLAKMDFNLLQSLYRSEINKVFRWWKELDFVEKLPYARDRVIDCYMWAIGINFLPEFSNGRIALAKLVNLIVLLDDIYDTFGKSEEMQHFSDAIERWDIRAIDQLPEYLRKPYITLYNFANDFEYMSLKHRENNSIYYVKKMVQDYCKASIQETRWFKDGYTPSMNEYMSISITTAAGYLGFLVGALGMGDMVDKQGLDYLAGDSKLPWLSCRTIRLLDDIATSKVEQGRGDVANSINCYMKEYGVSREEARIHVKNLLVETWKDINQELLNPIPLPRPLIKGIANYGKVGEMFYQNGNDGFGSSERCIIDNIQFMFLEPIPM